MAQGRGGREQSGHPWVWLHPATLEPWGAVVLVGGPWCRPPTQFCCYPWGQAPMTQGPGASSSG